MFLLSFNPLQHPLWCNTQLTHLYETWVNQNPCLYMVCTFILRVWKTLLPSFSFLSKCSSKLHSVEASHVTQQAKLSSAMPASHMRVSVQVMAASLAIQLPVHAPQKRMDYGQCTWTPTTYKEDTAEFYTPGFSLFQHWLMWPSENKPMSEESFSLSLSRVCPHSSAFKHIYV